MWVCPAAAAWGPSRRPTAVDVVWRLTKRFFAGWRRARGVGRVLGAMSAASDARAVAVASDATGFVIQRLQLLGRRDAREPRFLHPAVANEVVGPARTLMGAARALGGRWGLRLTIRA